MTGKSAPEIVPATPDRWSDVSELLDASAEQGCWCQAWRGTGAKAHARGRSRPEILRDQMADTPPPGYVAYLDGMSVGWVG
ncbi:MAG: GNAT family N-acetyltransferase, partial [Candidatus Limnocylindria bacterium]